jgi:prepilin-type N-terminal cleavage/methylation domain-containing protein
LPFDLIMSVSRSRPIARDQRGFTLIEVMTTVFVMALLSGMTVVAIGSALTAARGDTTMAQVAGILRSGREAAITQGRTIEVRFEGTNRIKLVRLDLPEGETVIGEVGLENGAKFRVDAQLPDTPDGFGNDEAIAFGDADSVRFLPNSSFADQNNVPINGTVFVGIPSDRNSARAVTVTGASARSQSYRWNGSEWEAR